MLELQVTDIGVRLNLFPEPDTVDDFYREYPPYDQVLGKGGSRRGVYHQPPPTSNGLKINRLQAVIALGLQLAPVLEWRDPKAEKAQKETIFSSEKTDFDQIIPIM